MTVRRSVTETCRAAETVAAILIVIVIVIGILLLLYRRSDHRRRHRLDARMALPRSAGAGHRTGKTHSPRRLPSTMSEHHERRSAALSLVPDLVLADRPGAVGRGVRSAVGPEQAAPTARGRQIAAVLPVVSRRPRC